MLFKLVGPLAVAYSVHRLTLQTFVDEVGGFLIPAIRNVILLDLYLAAQDLVTDIFASAPLVRSFAHHALISNDAHSEVVCSQAVILPAHHFGCHVARSSTSLA